MGRHLLGAWFSRWLERNVPSVGEDLSALDRADGRGQGASPVRAAPAAVTESAEVPPATGRG